MNENQKQLLQALRRDAFLSMAQIHKETGINLQTLHANFRNAKEKEIIKKATVLLDAQKLGYSHHIIFLFTFHNSNDAAFLQRKEEVNTIFELDEKHRYFVEAFFECGVSLDKFITEIEEKTQLENIKFWLVRREIARESFL